MNFLQILCLMFVVSSVSARPFKVLNSFAELKEYMRENKAGDPEDRDFKFELSCKPGVMFTFVYPTDVFFHLDSSGAQAALAKFSSLVDTDFLEKVPSCNFHRMNFVLAKDGSWVNLHAYGYCWDVSSDFVGEGFCSADRRK